MFKKFIFISILALSLFFHFSKPVMACTPGGNDCPSQCNGQCRGVCFYETYKKECTPLGCDSWPAEYNGVYKGQTCTCKYVGVGNICYYDAQCYETKCGKSECSLWSGWSPCGSNCYSWRYCREAGNDASENRWCCTASTPAPDRTPPPPIISCDVNLPDNLSVPLGYSNSVEAQLDNLVGIISTVNFSSGDLSVASYDPTTPPGDTEMPYYVSVTGESVGTTTITADVIISGSSRCSDTMNVTVTPPGPWWQVQDADIYSNGNLTSLISYSCSLPVCDPIFEINGTGGYPGIPIASGIISVGDFASVSSTNWESQTSLSLRKNYSYSFFERQLQSDTQMTSLSSNLVEGSVFSLEGILSNGAYWFKYDGSTSGQDLTINSDIDVGSRKVVLFVENANLYINGKILLDDGSGFFMAIVGKNSTNDKGNIYFSSDISGIADYDPEIEGIFFAEGQIDTGLGNNQLHLRGSFVGIEGINLQRNLTDNSNTPSELIEFGPDLLFTMPNDLKSTTINWTEIQP